MKNEMFFIELQFPEPHTPVINKIHWCVSTGQFGPYLAGDGNLKELPWLFETYEEAILASAKYYHRACMAYPWEHELREVCEQIILVNKTIKIESQVMEFI